MDSIAFLANLSPSNWRLARWLGVYSRKIPAILHACGPPILASQRRLIGADNRYSLVVLILGFPAFLIICLGHAIVDRTPISFKSSNSRSAVGGTSLSVRYVIPIRIFCFPKKSFGLTCLYPPNSSRLPLVTVIG